MSGGDVRARLRRNSVSILQPWVLLLERQAGSLDLQAALVVASA